MTVIKLQTTSGGVVVTPVLIMTIKGLLLSFLVTCGHTFGKDLLPPRFLVEPQSVIARSGSLLVLYCSVEPETATVRWMVNGSYLTSQKKRGFDIRDGSNLRIMSFNQPDSLLREGIYQCVASNSLGTIVSREARVEAAVLGSYPTARTVADMTAIEGNVAVIPCSLPESKPRAVVEFLFNGSKLSPSGRLVTLPSGNLQIARVSGQSDQGLYQCSAVNLVTGNSLTSPAAFRLRVIVPKTDIAAEFTSTSNASIAVNQGNNLTLECAAEGWPVPQITWEKYGGHLPVGRFSQVLGNLVISMVLKFDAGTYICRVNNSTEKRLRRVIDVNVFEPPSIETAPTDQTATEGSTVVFMCRPPQGSPKPSIQWLFNGELIINEQFVSIRDTTLTLSNIHRRRAGMYQCTVRNGIGMVHASARLTVVDPQVNNAKTAPAALPTAPGKHPVDNADYDEYEEDNDEEEEEDYEEYDVGRTQPSETTKRRPEDEKTRNRNSEGGGEMLAPTKPMVTVLTNTSVLLRWTMSTVVAGEPVVSKFKIQVKEIVEETSSRWQMLDDDVSYGLRMFEVGNLKPGRTYRFRIVVFFSNGDGRPKPGPVSARVALSTATNHRSQMPSPVVVEARALSKGEIMVGWQQQDVEQWSIVGFYIHYAPFGSNGNFQKVIVPGQFVRHHVLSHLAPATSYTIKMQSYATLDRESGFSNSVVKTTNSFDNEQMPGDHAPKFPPGRHATTPRGREVPSTDRPGGWEQALGDEGDGGGAERQQLTYVILGIVLGVIVIVVVSCASVCIWRRQKNQRYGDSEQKNADQATAFLGNKKPSKQDGLVNISDYTYKVDNGHLPNCSGDCTLSSGHRTGNGFCAGVDPRNCCPPRPNCQPRKLAPDLILPPPPAMPPPCHPYLSGNPEISIYDTVDDDHQRSSPAYAKVSSLDGDSTTGGHYTTFPSPPAFVNLVRPSSDNIPRPLDSHAYWVLEQSRNQSLPERPSNHVEPFIAPQPLTYRQNSSSSSQPSNKSLTKPPFDRECVIQNSTDEETDRYEKPTSLRSTLHSGLPSASSTFAEPDRMKTADAGRQFQPDPPTAGRRPLPKLCEASGPRDAAGHDSWKNLTSQVSDGQYTIQSGPAKTGALSTTAFALPRINDYPSSDQEDCR